jgi:hypothetical protein
VNLTVIDSNSTSFLELIKVAFALLLELKSISLLQKFKQFTSQRQKSSSKMSDQPPVTLEMINNNFISIMSLVIGINCRLNMLETLLSEIKEKMPVSDLEEEDEGSVESNASDEPEQENEAKVLEALKYSGKVICSMVAAEYENSEEEKKDEEKEATEIDDKSERNQF